MTDKPDTGSLVMQLKCGSTVVLPTNEDFNFHAFLILTRCNGYVTHPTVNFYINLDEILFMHQGPHEKEPAMKVHPEGAPFSRMN